jgi:predicted cupin superfamily sugar epimerase
MDPDQLIRTLAMQPHPEGGHYVETYRALTTGDERPACTAIYFLLKAGERSHWHKVDAVETWLWHAGSPLLLSIDAQDLTLGPDIAAGQRPQVIVPKDAWQAARSLGGWTLVSCIVAPGFSFKGFELAPPGWSPRPAGGA